VFENAPLSAQRAGRAEEIVAREAGMYNNRFAWWGVLKEQLLKKIAP
jgi:hypothetical protein